MKKRLQVTIKEENFELLERLSKELGVSKSTIITLAIQEYGRQQEEKKA